MNRWMLSAVVMTVMCGACVSQASEKAVAAPVVTATEAASTNAVNEQTECPIMGGKIDKDVYVDFEGKRIYLCCKGCIAPAKKDPKAIIQKMEEAGITLAETPKEEEAPKEEKK